MNSWSQVINHGLERLSFTLWVGGMIAVAVAVMVLFSNIADRALAGDIAGQLFNIINYVGVACAVLLLSLWFLRNGGATLKRWQSWAVFIMLLVVVASQWVIRPEIDAVRVKRDAAANGPSAEPLRNQFRKLHGLSFTLYFLNMTIGLAVVFSPVSGRREHG